MRAWTLSAIFHMTFAIGGIAVATSACGAAHSTSASSSDDADAGADASQGASDGATAAPPDVPPYPKGPYGGAIGDTMPNFSVAGYSLSRDQRDATKLPFREVSLAEARSAPGCECMVVLFDAAGHCYPSILENGALAAAISRDPSLCAIEVVAYNFDVLSAAGGPTPDIIPATKADLDQWVQSIRQDYPVGLMTNEASSAISAVVQQGIPNNIIVRTRDMKIVGNYYGVGDRLVETVRGICDAPKPGPGTLASGIAPRELAEDGERAFVVDRDLGLFSVAVAGGEKTTLLPASSSPAHLVVDAHNVYVVTQNGTIQTLVQMPKDGSAAITLAQGTAFGGVATDADNVYYTLDRTVASVPIGGATPARPGTTLSTETTDLGAIAVDASAVHFLAGAEVASIQKIGNARTTLAGYGTMIGANRTAMIPGLLAAGPTHHVFVGGMAAQPHDGLVLSVKPNARPVTFAGTIVPSALASAPDGTVFGALTAGSLLQGEIVAFDGASDNQSVTPIVLGQPRANAIAGDTEYVYWTNAESAPGARDGTLLRIARHAELLPTK
jgi:hypothetical protein